MYRKILLTHDGSELASAAIPHVEMLAEATGASLLVLAVIDSTARFLAQSSAFVADPSLSGAVTADIAEQAVAAQRATAEERLAGLKSQLEASGIENVETLILDGAPSQTIVRCAEDEGCDLIVMATHGRSGLGRAVLGSVADYVVRNTPHSAVLLVRPEG